MTAERVRESGVEWGERGIKTVEGYWCHARLLDDPLEVKRILFGRDPFGYGLNGICPLAMNNLTPFSSAQEAETAREHLRARSGLGDVVIVKLKLEIGMSPEDWEGMRTHNSYVVIWRRYEHDILLVGGAIEGRPHTTQTIPGADIQDTDLKPIFSYETAIDVRYEVARQGRGVGRGAYLATFQIKETG